MVNFTRMLFLIGFLLLVQPVTANASPACPIQGLDSKVCPIVVSFFDDVAKNNPDFATHWKNHHWVGQIGSNFSFQNLDLKIHTHMTMMFGKRNKTFELEKFIDDTLTRAAKNDPKFQQVIDSHNFFVMTVQAMHLALQSGADHFNVSGSPRVSASGALENEELELTAVETDQVPTTDPFLNKAGIYFTDKYRYQHSVKIDSTTYKAGVTVAPVVVGVSSPTIPKPKGHKIPVSGQQKSISGAGGGSAQPPPANKQNVNAPITIQKQPGNRGRPGGGPPPATSTKGKTSGTPKGTKTSGPGQQKQIYIVQVPTTVSSKPGLHANQQNLNSPVTIQKQLGSQRGRPSGATPVTSSKSQKPPAPGQQKSISGAGGGSAQPPPANKQNVNAPTVTQKQPVGTPGQQSVSRPTSHNVVRPSKISLIRGPRGTDKRNVNVVLTTQKAGSQTHANERVYVIDDNNKIWSCKVSSLGFRVTVNSDGSLTKHGHVESAQVKSAQLAHIPANHAMGCDCLISVQK